MSAEFISASSGRGLAFAIGAAGNQEFDVATIARRQRKLRELVEYGVFESVDSSAHTWKFRAHYIVLARKACRLRHDFELDAHSLAVLLGFVERIDSLQREVLDLRAQVSTTRRQPTPPSGR